jgi:hypothetical protein
MVRRLHRPTGAQLVKGILLVAAVLIVAHAELRGASQGEAITEIKTRVDHTQTVELCSTTASCRRLLDELIASIGPHERRELRQRFAPHPASLPAAARRLAPRVAHRHRVQQHRAVKRGAAHRRRTARAPHLLAPAPAEAFPAAPPAPPPAPPAASPPSSESPGQGKKPGHLLCVHLPVAERLLCR